MNSPAAGNTAAAANSAAAGNSAPGNGAPAADRLVPPHGGRLVDRVLTGDRLAAARERLPALRLLPISEAVAADLELIATGAYSPLEGFLDRAGYRSVLAEMHLPGGLPWTLPITLPAPPEAAAGLREGEEVCLAAGDGEPLGLLEVREVYRPDREEEARRVYGTLDPAHPGVRRLAEQGEAVYLAGPVWLLRRRPAPFPDLALDPAETRRIFAGRGWRQVVGFQTRNPIHRAHEYIQKVALEVVDGLLIHPLLGETKADDLPAPVRVRAYREVVDRYFPRDRVLLAAFPAAMRYAGPREAVFHALVRKNYGCSHFIVGRDHAGVGRFYDPEEAQRIFDRFDPALLGVVPLRFSRTFWCRACGAMASEKTCPHGEADRLSLSGTRVREWLQAGRPLPAELTRPEVARTLAAALSEGALAGDG
nr:MAG: sulfate adenylyltransferase [Bacillota bacterium]